MARKLPQTGVARKRLALVAVLLACAAPRPQPPRGVEVLRVDGRVENAPFRFGRDDLPALPQRGFETVGATGQGERRRYDGVAVDALLADRMELKRDADTAVVHGARGVAVPVPLVLLRQLRPVLADTVDTPSRRAPGEPPVELVLAWPASDHPGIESDLRFRWWWVRDVRRIEIASWTDTYGRALRVPAGASDDARHGADLLAAQCMGCHAVRGIGGTRGPSLTDERSRAVLRDAAARFAGHLRRVSGSATAPTITPAMASHVAAFLDAVHVAGPDREPPGTAPSRPPDEEPPMPEPPITGPPIGGRPGGP